MRSDRRRTDCRCCIKQLNSVINSTIYNIYRVTKQKLQSVDICVLPKSFIERHSSTELDTKLSCVAGRFGYSNSVCLSVRPSARLSVRHTPVCVKMNQHRTMPSSVAVSAMYLVLAIEA